MSKSTLLWILTGSLVLGYLYLGKRAKETVDRVISPDTLSQKYQYILDLADDKTPPSGTLFPVN